MHWVSLSREEWDEFRDVQIRPRADWPATFSCNHHREVWPYITFGYTAPSERLDLRGQIPRLDEIVDWVLEIRPGGGRFFISDEGVFIRPEDWGIKIAEFDIR